MKLKRMFSSTCLNILLMFSVSPIQAWSVKEVKGMISTIKVTTLVDTPDEDCTEQKCSLRAAVKKANATEAKDYIEFTVTGVHRLTEGPLVVTAPLAIRGLGSPHTILDGLQKNPIFEASADLDLDQMTLQNGKSEKYGGAAVFSWNANLVIQNSVVQNNECTGNICLGGGLYASLSSPGQRIDVSNVFFFNNKGRAGGALYASLDEQTRIQIASSTFENNQTSLNGGALLIYAGSSGEATILNSTFSNNHSESTHSHNIQIKPLKNIEIFNSTIDGGDEDTLSLDADEIHLQNSIITSRCEEPASAIISEGGNVVAGTTCLDGSQPDDVIGVADVYLGSLVNNGGLTPTFALLSGSPALGQAVENANTPSTDQRGYPRIAPIDSGAFQTFCGDGIISGEEACDDGNSIDADDCSNHCEKKSKTPFLRPEVAVYKEI